jgi:hypothetical protein
MFSTELFIIAKHWIQTKLRTMEEWLSKYGSYDELQRKYQNILKSV